MIAKYLFTPSSNINYNFVSSAYGLFALLSVILYTLETQVFISYTSSEQGQHGGGGSAAEDGGAVTNESMRELAESTKGLYLIFVPFIPCLVWSLIIRHQWKKTVGVEVDDTVKEKDE